MAPLKSLSCSLCSTLERSFSVPHLWSKPEYHLCRWIHSSSPWRCYLGTIAELLWHYADRMSYITIQRGRMKRIQQSFQCLTGSWEFDWRSWPGLFWRTPTCHDVLVICLWCVESGICLVWSVGWGDIITTGSPLARVLLWHHVEWGQPWWFAGPYYTSFHYMLEFLPCCCKFVHR